MIPTGQNIFDGGDNGGGDGDGDYRQWFNALPDEMQRSLLSSLNGDLMMRIIQSFEMVRANLNVHSHYIVERVDVLTSEELSTLYSQYKVILALFTQLAEQTLLYDGLSREKEWHIPSLIASIEEQLGLGRGLGLPPDADADAA